MTCSQRHASTWTSSQGRPITPTSRHSASRCLRMTRVASSRPVSVRTSWRSPSSRTRLSRSILATVWLTVGPLWPRRSAIRARSGTMPSSSHSKMVRRYISVVSISPCAVTLFSLRSRCYAVAAGAGSLAAPAKGCRPSSGREAFDDPVRPLPTVTQPVVQPVGPALPELDDVVPEPVTAPEAGHGHDRSLRPALLQPRVTLVEHGARADHRRLPAGPGPELGTVRAGMEVWLAVVLGQGRDRALDDHLAVQRVPGEQQARPGVPRQVLRLGGRAVGVEGEAVLPVALEQDRPRARPPG